MREPITTFTVNDLTIQVYITDEETIRALNYESDAKNEVLGCFLAKHEALYLLDGMGEINLIHTIYHEVAHAYIYAFGVHIDTSEPLMTEESICDLIGALGQQINDDSVSIHREICKSNKYHFGSNWHWLNGGNS